MKNPLFQEISKATGLPEELIERELMSLSRKSDKPMDQITLDDLRELLADYLQDVLLGAKKELADVST